MVIELWLAHLTEFSTGIFSRPGAANLEKERACLDYGYRNSNEDQAALLLWVSNKGTNVSNADLRPMQAIQ